MRVDMSVDMSVDMRVDLCVDMLISGKDMLLELKWRSGWASV